MNVLFIVVMLFGSSGAIPTSPMARELDRRYLEIEDESLASLSWEYLEFFNNFDIAKTSERWVVRDGEILFEVVWHATSKNQRLLLTNPPRYPEKQHIVWKEYFGVVDGRIQLVETVVGTYVQAENASVEWPE